MMTRGTERPCAHDGAARVAIVGNLNMDLLLGPLAHPPTFGHEAFVAEQSLRPAGQAFQTAMALAALGDSPCLVGDVGDDPFGAGIAAALRAGGVSVAGVHTCPGRSTGLSVALFDERRDRAFVTHLGHLEELDDTAVMDRWGHIAGCRFLLLCGYFCLPGMRASGGEALRRARADGMTTVLDTGWDPDGWTASTREEIRVLLRQIDIFMPNQDEAHALTGLTDPAAAAAELASWGPATTIVKLGPDGALGRRHSAYERVAALPTAVADTVGAGDAFNAGALYALARGRPLATVLRVGVAVASHAIARREPRYATVEHLRNVLGYLDDLDAPRPEGDKVIPSSIMGGDER